jgi:uncharacterized protein
MERVRIAAVGDIHCGGEPRDPIVHAFAELTGRADVLLLAGDLTTHGLPEEARVLADACRSAAVPVFAVLGNHDYHSGCADEVAAILRDAGVTVLERSHAVEAVGDVDLGIVGTKGFVGGFAGAELPDFGEPLLREVYRETSAEVDALELGLEAVSGCQRRVVLLHYAPVAETLVGEPETIWAFLGSGRLAAPIGAHRPDLVVHGHAHHGIARGSIGTIPVHNVALHVTGHPLAVFEV